MPKQNWSIADVSIDFIILGPYQLQGLKSLKSLMTSRMLELVYSNSSLWIGIIYTLLDLFPLHPIN